MCRPAGNDPLSQGTLDELAWFWSDWEPSDDQSLIVSTLACVAFIQPSLLLVKRLGPKDGCKHQPTSITAPNAQFTITCETETLNTPQLHRPRIHMERIRQCTQHGSGNTTLGDLKKCPTLPHHVETSFPISRSSGWWRGRGPTSCPRQRCTCQIGLPALQTSQLC